MIRVRRKGDDEFTRGFTIRPIGGIGVMGGFGQSNHCLNTHFPSQGFDPATGFVHSFQTSQAFDLTNARPPI